MVIFLKIAIVLLNIIYFIFKLFPTKNKITMISRQSNSITLDFKLLKNEIEKRKQYKVVILTKKLSPGIISKIKYIFHMFRQMWHIATSKVVILDSYCIAISNLKHKKSLLIIQMWHAMGSLKKFGYSALESSSTPSALKNVNKTKKKEIANVMNMHKNYDYFFTSSKKSLPFFAEAFNLDQKKGVIMSLPTVDLIKDSKYKEKRKKDIINTYPSLKNKKIILYVPTFRDNENDKYIKKLINSIDYNKYNLIIKLHPLSKIDNFDDRVIWDKKYSSLDMLTAADYIITDYSAIVYEACLFEKPIYFYAYDLKDYIKTRDFYIDYKKEMPGLITDNPEKIIKEIENNNYDITKIKRFNKENIKYDKNITKQIVDFIEKNIKR